MKTHHLIQLHRVDNHALATEVAAGLRARRAEALPKFVFDPLGSRLLGALVPRR